MGIIDIFKQRTDVAITNQSAFNSIPPVAVGNKITQLADIVESFKLVSFDPEANDNNGYLTEAIVIYNENQIYASLVDQNKIVPGTDNTKWELILDASEIPAIIIDTIPDYTTTTTTTTTQAPTTTTTTTTIFNNLILNITNHSTDGTIYVKYQNGDVNSIFGPNQSGGASTSTGIPLYIAITGGTEFQYTKADGTIIGTTSSQGIDNPILTLDDAFFAANGVNNIVNLSFYDEGTVPTTTTTTTTHQ